jgi:adenylylsulfate kinase-like enzyme
LLLDGDDLRKTLNQDLSFSKEDRMIAVERVIDQITQTSSDYVVVAMITPFHKSRQLIKEYFGNNVLLTFLDCSTPTCKIRDQKGLYSMNPDGLLTFEVPLKSDLKVDSETRSIRECFNIVIQSLLGLDKN